MRLSLLDSTIEIQAPRQVCERLSPLLEAIGPVGCEATTTIRVMPVPGALHVSDGNDRFRVTSAAEAAEIVAMLVNRSVLAQCRSFAAHAGAVARSGQVVAFAAGSGVGKSTLTAALLRVGWEYVSDEALVVAWSGETVRAYAKPLSLDRWSLRRLGLDAPPGARAERLVHPRELGATAARAPLVVRHLVRLQRADAARISARPRLDGAAHVLAHAFNHYHDPPAAMRLVAGLAQGARSWLLELDDPVEAAELLTEVIGLPPTSPAAVRA